MTEGLGVTASGRKS